MRRVIGLAEWAALGAAVCFGAFAQAPVANGGFEEGKAGDVPTGWFVSKSLLDAGYKAEIADTGCVKGQCAVVHGLAKPPQPGMFGNLMQSVPADGYRERFVKLKASLRVEGAGTQAQMWLRLDRVGGGMVSIDNMSDRPVTASEWRSYEIEMPVPAETGSFALGVMVMGGGRAVVDEVTLEAGRPFSDFSFTKPAELNERQVRNLTAFTRLYGYVRFFHPSDEAAVADWTAVAGGGVKAVLGAADDAALQAKLAAVFGPLAPTMVLWRGTARPEPKAEAGTGEVIRWSHAGVGLKERLAPAGQGPYRSLRETKPGSLPEKPFEAELVPGLWARVPLVLAVKDGLTLPLRPALEPATFRAIPGDRDVRFADIALAWNVFQHFYPYFEVVGTDWAAELPRTLRAAAVAPDAEAYGRVLRRMVAALQDGHGNVSGVGGEGGRRVVPFGWDWVDGQMIVTKRDEGVSAVALGDRVVAMDGRPVSEIRAQWEPLISAATRQFREFRLWYDMPRCAGAAMKLEVEPFGAAAGTRREVEVTCRGAKPGREYPTETKPDAVKELEPGIFYLDLDRITKAQWDEVEGKLPGAKGLVFDLRGYPNEVALEVLRHITEKPVRSAQFRVPLVTQPDRVAMEFRDGGWPLEPKAPYFPGKKVFLTDGRAISYAETVMGMVENFKLAGIVGGATAGTNGNVNPFRLPSGATISWTGMQVLKHDGGRHHGVGILPTVEVKRSRAGIGAGRDEVLEAGLAVVR